MAILIVAALGLAGGKVIEAARQSVAVTGASPTLSYSDTAGGWSVDYPDGWYVTPWMLNGAAFTSYDPRQAAFEQGVGFNTAAATPPASEVRVQVEVWPTRGLDLASFVAQFIGPAAPSEATYRTIGARSETVAGFQASRMSLYERGTELREALYWIFTTNDGRAFVVHAWPARTTRLAEVQAMVDSLKVSTGIAGVLDPAALARTRQKLYELTPSPSFAHAGGGYISPGEAVNRAAAFATQGPITKQEVHLIAKGDVDTWLGSDDANVAKDREVYVVILQTPYVPDHGVFTQSGCGYLIAVLDAVTARVYSVGGCGRPLGTGNWPLTVPAQFAQP